MRVILFIIGMALGADGLYCGYTGSMGLGEAIIVGAGVMFILWGSFYEAFREKGFLRAIKGIFVFCMIVLVVYSASIYIIGKNDNASWREDYVIVLGAGLEEDEPSAVLERRLDKAIEYSKRNPDASIIVSGGQGEGENISEGLAMNNYLVMNGVDSGRILIEENAKSTYENFYYSKEAMADGSTVFITNEFHVLRSALMAQLNGIDATHISASTPLVQLPVCCARELVAQIASVRYYLPTSKITADYN